jgi:hypothetical protein
VSETINGSNTVMSVTNTLYGGALKAPTLGSQALYNAAPANDDIAVLADVNGATSGVAQTAVTLQKNVQYTETFSVGQGLVPNVLGGFAGFSFEVADLTTSTNLTNAEVHNSGQDNPDPGTFYDYSFTFYGSDFVTGKKGAPKAGDVLKIGFVIGVGTYITDVRLDEVMGVPEPSTLVLLASGLIGLLAYAWRKRK